MPRRFPVLGVLLVPFLLPLTSVGGLAAQEPVDAEATAILEAVLDTRTDRMAEVRNYTVVQAMNGMESTLYYERVEADGYPAYRIVPPHEYQRQRLEEAGFGGPAGPGGLPGAPGPGAAGEAGPPGAATPGAPAPSGPTPGREGGPPGMPDLSSLAEDLPPLPGDLSDLSGGLPGLAGDAKDMLDGLPGGLPGGLGGGGGEAGNGGGGGLMERALGAAAQGAAGGVQQRLMQKGMESLMDMASTAGDPRAEALLEAELVRALSTRAQRAGTEPVDGVECQVLTIDDLEGVDFGMESDEFEPSSITLWVDVDASVIRRSVLEGEVRMDGRAHSMRMEALEQDFREVEGMVEPFRRVMRMSGLMEAMAEADPEQMEEMRRAMEQMEKMEEQLEAMPPEQRRMVEAQMGPMRERMEQMMGGMEADEMEMVMEVRELRVNEGPPDALGTARLSLEGPLDIELDGMIPRIFPVPGQSGPETLWSIELLGRTEDGRTVIVQIVHRGDLPASGTTIGTARIAISGAGGAEAGFATEEDGATLTITSRTESGPTSPGRIGATLEFRAAGEVHTPSGPEAATISARGSFEAPIPPTDLMEGLQAEPAALLAPMLTTS